MDVREVHRRKHPSPKLVTEVGITVLVHAHIIVLLSVFMIALQFSLESYTGFFSSTVICTREEQPPKQYSPKLVTEDGIVMDVKEEQNPKHQFPKLVTEDGIVMDVKEEQSSKQ